tara:strand:+ start:523 stop:915 length:393 start_codon:yes stop_codon:yes gene_type:complete
MGERMTADQFRKASSKGATKGRVRGTKKTTVQGVKFASKREANHWLVLRDRQAKGEIGNLRTQVPYELQGRGGPILTPTGKVMRYIADFVYVDWDLHGKEVIADAKGYQTDVSKMKLAILAAQGVEVTLV